MKEAFKIIDIAGGGGIGQHLSCTQLPTSPMGQITLYKCTTHKNSRIIIL